MVEASFYTLGDEALLVNFEQKIDVSINGHVHLLDKKIEEANHPAILFTTPSYCSLTIGFNKEQISYKNLELFVKNILVETEKVEQNDSIRKLYIPVCYSRKFGLDLDEVSETTELDASEIVELHTDQIFRTYMVGFLPGFPYLGALPKSMFCNRKSTPRLTVPKGSVGIAGLQTGIYPNTSPGGWQIIGNTPVNLNSSEHLHPFLFQPGDNVQFYSISESKHEDLLKEQMKGSFDWTNIYE